MNEYLHKDLTTKIIKCFYNVFDELGYVFLESVYESALLLELKSMGLKVERQKYLEIFYKCIFNRKI